MNMKGLSAVHFPHSTSVSLREKSYRRVIAVEKLLNRKGVFWSKQEIYRRLLRLYLAKWRGNGLKSDTLRRYNKDAMEYGVFPLYINRVLHSLLVQRAQHSGESISRMLDFAIRNYTGRLLEEVLSKPGPGRAPKNTEYWARRHNRRKLFLPFFINYQCKTEKNGKLNFVYTQTAEIILKKGLSIPEIMHAMLNFA